MVPFADYHRTVVGYHGTLRETAIEIVKGERNFKFSTNDYDWLGSGIYFWEHAPKQALSWAQQRYRKRRRPVAVLGAMIRLGHCFDLMDPENAKLLKSFNSKMIKDFEETNTTVPKNCLSKKYLDCLTLNAFYKATDTSDELPGKIDTCRAAYVPTQSKDRLWPSSWLYHDTHVQICVRNTACILGVWMVHSME